MCSVSVYVGYIDAYLYIPQLFLTLTSSLSFVAIKKINVFLATPILSTEPKFFSYLVFFLFTGELSRKLNIFACSASITVNSVIWNMLAFYFK